MQDNNIIQNAINCIKRLDKENTELKAENDRLKEQITNVERIAREGYKDYYYTHNKNNPFFLNIIEEVDR